MVRKQVIQRVPSSKRSLGERSQLYGTLVPPSHESLRQPPSERDTNSQHSWSPSITEHAAFTPVAPKLRKPSAEITAKERKPLDASLIPPRSRTCSKIGSYHQLEEEFGRRYGDYLALNKWLDNRLEIFKQLRSDLESSSATSVDVKQQHLIFKLIVEDRRLKDDREYQEKMELLEECHASLLMIKSRLASLVRSSA